MAAGEKVIPEITVGNQTYKLMDETAREHLVEVKSTTPTSEDNRLWIKEMSAAEEEANTYEVPTIDEFNDLKSAIDYKEIEFTRGKYYQNNISPINTTQEDSVNWECALVPCSEGDMFTISGQGSNSERLYVFVDSNYEFIDGVHQATTVENLVITAPKNSAYLVMDNRDFTKKSYYGTIANRVDRIENNLLPLPVSIKFTYGKYFANTAGPKINISTMETSVSWSCALVPCSEGDIFTLNGHGSNGDRLYTFVDSNGFRITGAAGEVTANNLIVIAPKDAAYLVLNNNDSTKKSYYGGQVNGNIQKVKDEIHGVENYLHPLYGCLPSSKIEMTRGKYIPTSGTTLTVGAVETSVNFECAWLPCSEGDRFTISGLGTEGELLYVFVDASGNKLQSAPGAMAATKMIIIAPENAAYLAINNKDFTKSSYRGQSFDDWVNKVEELTDPEREVIYSEIVVRATGGKLYLVKDVPVGESIENTINNSASCSYTEQIPIFYAENGQVFITADNVSSDSSVGFAFTDNYGKILSSYITSKRLKADNGVYKGFAKVPKNAKYMYYSGKGSSSSITVRMYPEKTIKEIESYDLYGDLVKAQKAVADDWNLKFLNVYNNLGLGYNHQIPGTAQTWSEQNTRDLTQREVWMPDGLHPALGVGVVSMYADALAAMLKTVPQDERANTYAPEGVDWSGKTILWMGTSIPEGSDTHLSVPGRTSYPVLTCRILEATAVNISRGSSCIRANASNGKYSCMNYGNFKRSLTRALDEITEIVEDWDNIKVQMEDAPASIPSSDIEIMQSHSFENLLLPYLNGTNAMPDLFVIDHGNNDSRMYDTLLEPSLFNIENGYLAEDTYMTDNNYANLKLAFDNDLSGISNLPAFAASVNRNCFRGAMNFIITLILRYNPHARICIVSNYDDISIF